MPELSSSTLLLYGASAVLAVVYVVASVGVLCMFGEALYRLASFHRRGMARARGQL